MSLFNVVIFSGVTRGLSQGGAKLSWKRPTVHRRGPTSQNSEKKL